MAEQYLLWVGEKADYALKYEPNTKGKELQKATEATVVPRYKKENVKAYEECFVKDANKDTKLIKLNKYDLDMLLVRSPVYDNVYYPLDKYAQYYKEDMRKEFSNLSSYMGASERAFAFVEKAKLNEVENKTTQSNAGIDYVKSIFANLRLSFSHHATSQQESNYDKHTLEHSCARGDNGKHIAIPKRHGYVKKYIKDNKINLDNFPSEFAQAVNDYADGRLETCECYYKKDDNVSEDIRKCEEKSFEVMADFDVFFGKANKTANANINKQDTKEKQVKSSTNEQIIYYLKIKKWGVLKKITSVEWWSENVLRASSGALVGIPFSH